MGGGSHFEGQKSQVCFILFPRILCELSYGI